MRTLLALAVLPFLAAPSLAADQPWQSSTTQERAYSAFLRNEGFSNVVVNCREGEFSDPEISVTIHLDKESRLSSTSVLIFAET